MDWLIQQMKLKRCLKMKLKMKNYMKQYIFLKGFFTLMTKNQLGQGLKILTLNQILSRLPIY